MREHHKNLRTLNHPLAKMPDLRMTGFLELPPSCYITLSKQDLLQIMYSRGFVTIRNTFRQMLS